MKKENVFDISIKIEKEEFDKALDKALDKKIKTVEIDGFRKGHVSKEVYLNKFGKESLYMDAVDILLPDAYDKALKDKTPIIEPKVDLTEINENGCTLLFTITTRPKVTIKAYKNLKVKKDKVDVSKEEIDTEINDMLKKYSELVVKEGPVANKDIAIIDFEGFKDGVAFEGGKGTNYSLEIGSGSFIPGFEEQLIGMNKNDVKDIKVTFPKEYPSEELKGQEVTFTVKVNEIKEKVERKLDEEFFADLALNDVKDEESLRKQVKETITSSKEIEAENKFVDELLAKIAEGCDVDIPEELVDHEVHHMIERFNEQLRMQGMDINYYYTITKQTESDLHKQMEPEALKNIKYRFILEEVKNLENITVTDEEVEEEATKTASGYGMTKEDFLNSIGGISAMKYEVELRKVIDYLKENN